jgi:hypothetical protein
MFGLAARKIEVKSLNFEDFSVQTDDKTGIFLSELMLMTSVIC